MRTKPKKSKIRMAFKLPPDLTIWLWKEAQKTNRTMTAIVTLALRKAQSE